MENKDPELKKLANNIRSTCKKIVNKPDVQRANNNNEYFEFLNKAENDTEANQEIIQEKGDKLFYANIKDNTGFYMYQILCKPYLNLDNVKRIPELFHGVKEIEPEKYACSVSIKPGDVEIFFNDTVRNEISEKGTTYTKSKLLLLGEHGVITQQTKNKIIPNREIIPATVKDLTVILEGLKKLL